MNPWYLSHVVEPSHKSTNPGQKGQCIGKSYAAEKVFQRPVIKLETGCRIATSPGRTVNSIALLSFTSNFIGSVDMVGTQWNHIFPFTWRIICEWFEWLSTSTFQGFSTQPMRLTRECQPEAVGDRLAASKNLSTAQHLGWPCVERSWNKSQQLWSLYTNLRDLIYVPTW